MKDYSQHGESKFLFDFIKNNNILPPAYFVEVGALDGVRNSNSRLFIEAGWSATLVEPNPFSFSALINNTKHFNNVNIFNVAIAESFDIKNFDIVTRKNFEGWSSLDEKGEHKVITVPIDFLIKNQKVGIMSIDAEGYDTKIVDYLINNTTIRPHFLIIENMTKEDKVTNQQKQKKILEKEYTFLKQIRVNGIWQLKNL